MSTGAEAGEAKGARGSQWAMTSWWSPSNQEQQQSVQLQQQEDRLKAVENKLALHEQRIEELTQELKEKNIRETLVKTQSQEASLGMGADLSTQNSVYEFESSIWDATLMLFVGHGTFVDKMILMLGVFLNFSLQISLLVIFQANEMLDPPYSANKVEEMMQWRVENGHNELQFHEPTQQTKAQRLCKVELWSFEQSEFEDMNNYLYLNIPGAVLSGLAVILWVFTCMREYRSIVEQVLALVNLPAAKKNDPIIKETRSTTEVIAIRPCHRAMAFITLSLPRFIVLGFLCYVGCVYLSRTVTLSDIVLNAVALAFILDVDEAVCMVVLTQRLRTALSRMQPLTCAGASTFKGIAIKDIVRFLLTVSIISVTIAQVLIPFHGYVESVATALCGGNQEFTYTGGGSASHLDIVLKDSSIYSAACDEGSATEVSYMNSYYAGTYKFQNNGVTTSSANVSNWTAETLRQRVLAAVWAHALSGCPSGQIKSPNPEARDSCVPIPTELQTKLTSLEAHGLKSKFGTIESCFKLDVTKGGDACNIQDQEICLSTWTAQRCERENGRGGDPVTPGYHFNLACQSEDYAIQCEEWRRFNLTHPNLNCELVDLCPGHDCEHGISGTVSFAIGNSTAFEENQTETTTAVRDALVTTIGIRDATQVGVYPQTARLLSTGANTATYLFDAVTVPVDVTRTKLLARNMTLTRTLNSLLQERTGASDVVDGTTWTTVSFVTQADLNGPQGERCDIDSPRFNCELCEDCRRDRCSFSCTLCPWAEHCCNSCDERCEAYRRCDPTCGPANDREKVQRNLKCDVQCEGQGFDPCDDKCPTYDACNQTGQGDPLYCEHKNPTCDSTCDTYDPCADCEGSPRCNPACATNKCLESCSDIYDPCDVATCGNLPGGQGQEFIEHAQCNSKCATWDPCKWENCPGSSGAMECHPNCTTNGCNSRCEDRGYNPCDSNCQDYNENEAGCNPLCGIYNPCDERCGQSYNPCHSNCTSRFCMDTCSDYDPCYTDCDKRVDTSCNSACDGYDPCKKECSDYDPCAAGCCDKDCPSYDPCACQDASCSYCNPLNTTTYDKCLQFCVGYNPAIPGCGGGGGR